MKTPLSRRDVVQALLLICIAAGIVFLIVGEMRLDRPKQLAITTFGSVDMCLSCHKDEKLDAAHDAKVIGCAVCHLGDPLAISKEDAHEGMVLNPGDLRVVEKTCSVEGCHPLDATKVKHSLMATNRGIIGTLLYYWGESDSQDSDLTVEQLMASGQTSLGLDYFRKLCGTCHLWKQKNDMPGIPQFFNEKGGGCSACHYDSGENNVSDMVLVGDGRYTPPEKEKGFHPKITRAVSSVHCVRCHNRSGRIGISYMGIFESEGYGTPYEDGKLNHKQLPGARFYLDIADDVHHKQGMECIDCHTRNEIMGDGTSYAHYEEQLEISCTVCHSATPGTTRKNNTLTNLETADGGARLIGKVDHKVHPLRDIKSGVCDFPAHKRVGCEACHSTWVAQCYGCHVKRDEAREHLDKLSLEPSKGLWEEGRSYIRYEQPMLGVWEDEVVVVTPGCQDVVTMVNERGELEDSFNRFTMAAINPHTTQKVGRSCADCHSSTKTVGLGEGRLAVVADENGEAKLSFISQSKGLETAAGTTVPLDAWVSLDGKILQHGSRSTLRPFNALELKAILRVGLCVQCHEKYDDPAWKTYTRTSFCPRAGELKGQGGAMIQAEREAAQLLGGGALSER